MSYITAMTPRKKLETGLYVPPGRRNERENFDGISPIKSPEVGSSRVVPPNCCEDEEEEELNVSSTKNDTSSVVSFSSVSIVSSIESSPPKVTKDFQKKLRMGRQGYKSDRIPVHHRVVLSNNPVRKDFESTESSNSQNGFPNSPDDSFRSDASYESILDTFHQTNVQYIDSHCHTDFMYNNLLRRHDPQKHEGLAQWITKYPRAFPKSFSGLIANFIKPDLFVDSGNNDEYDFEWILRELQLNYYLGTTWGCHPHHVTQWGKNGFFWTTLKYILSNKKTYKVLAIGECGIDLNRCESKLEDQIEVFEKHIDLAFSHKLPLVIHCRSGHKGQAEDICLNILEKKMNVNHPFLKIHRHCFTENWETAKKWLEQCPDVHFGYTAALLSFKEPQIEAVRRIPLDRILLETDGPYFKPKCFDRVSPAKVCLPGMAIATAAKLAEIKQVPMEEVLRATYNNTRRVYQIAL
uniref:Deoxyribonuclease TATDN2 n=2 Tax=Caenorhabditis tropicalis TaxID=1561998 RepID=A0A1I7TZB2_9PELO